MSREASHSLRGDGAVGFSGPHSSLVDVSDVAEKLVFALEPLKMILAMDFRGVVYGCIQTVFASYVSAKLGEGLRFGWA